MYRKFNADQLFTGYGLLDNGNVLITDNGGKIIDIVAVAEAGDDVQHFNGILSPGFINAHCHLELSHMKGRIPGGTGLVDFVIKVISERHFREEEILNAIEMADQEMYSQGIVAVGDICNTAFTISQKQKTKLRYHNFIEASGFPSSIAELRFQRSLDLYNRYSLSCPDNSIVPHAPYSVSPELFSLINAYPSNKVLSIHNQETAAENELFENRKGDFLRLYEKLGIDISNFKSSGKTSLQTYLPYLKKYESLILVHNVFTNAADISFVKSHTSGIIHQPSVFYCLCPGANLYISDSLPDVSLFTQPPSATSATLSTAADGITNIVLGTDSLASNHQLSILEEMKTLQQYFPTLLTETLLQWATINGARALKMDGDLGSFEKGKNPGLIIIDHLEQNILTTNSTVKRIL